MTTTNNQTQTTTSKTFILFSNDNALKVTFEIWGDVGKVDYRGAYTDDIIADPFVVSNQILYADKFYTVKELKQAWVDLRKTPYWDRGDVRGDPSRYRA